MEVIVPDEFLSIAIGKRGQNVRLASKLTEWHLDVISEEKYNQAMQDGYNSLEALPGVDTGLAGVLFEKGVHSAQILSRAPIDELLQINGIEDEEQATTLVEAAEQWVIEDAERKAVEAERAAAEAEAEKAAAEKAALEAEAEAEAVEKDASAPETDNPPETTEEAAAETETKNEGADEDTQSETPAETDAPAVDDAENDASATTDEDNPPEPEK
jgi:N utilization substance protein A